MSDNTATPDVRQLAAEKLPETAFPAGGRQDFRVYFSPAVHAAVAAHAAEKRSVEICGVLVGGWQRDPDGPFVAVAEAIRCDSAVSHAGEVTFTHDAWNVVNREMDTRFTDLKIVGWYHSHPSFGIFLSERDCFIQQHFFSSPGQIAYVVDPVGKSEGVFAWRGGKPQLCPHFWVGDRVHLSVAASSAPAAAGEQAADPAPARRDGGPLLSSSALTTIIISTLCLLLGLYMGDRKTEWEEIMVQRGAVRHYGLLQGLRPGLRENLKTVDQRLQKIGAAVDLLAREHVALVAGAQESKETKKAKEEKAAQWGDVEKALEETRLGLVDINAMYSLNPEQSAELERLIQARDMELDGVKRQGAAAAGTDAGDTKGPAKPGDQKKAAEK